MASDERKGRPGYFDVDKFLKVYRETLHKSTGVRRFLGRLGWSIGSVQGFFVAIMAFPLVIGTLLLIIIGVSYGPLVFLALFGGLIAGLGFVVDRKVGRSLQFGEYKFWRRTLAQSAAFLLALGLVFFLIVLSRLRPF